MAGPIPLSAADFSAVLEAAELDPGGGSADGAASNGGAGAGSVTGASAVPEADGAVGALSAALDGSGVGLAPEAPATGCAGSVPSSDAIPDPFDDADALSELEHEVITLSAHIEAATFRLLVLIADFDRRRGWELGGHRSCAHWLHYVTGLDLGAAREKVRAARALEHLPRTREAMARGELSFSKVRALTRVATPESEEEVLERVRYESRTFSVFPDDEGMYVVKGKLPAEVGALLMRAVEAAADALFCREVREETTPGQRRADALGLVAERAMAAGFGGGADRSGSGETRISDTRTEDADRDGSAESSISEDRDEQGPAGDRADTGVSAEIPISSTRAERYQVFLHVEPDTLRMGGSDPGRSHLEDGVEADAEVSSGVRAAEALTELNRARGITPDGEKLRARYRRESDIPWDVLASALEALDEAHYAE